MVPFNMPLDAKLALAKMSVIYEREIGSKIKMSRDEDIVSLINFAVDSFNEEIIKYLDAFISYLGPGDVRQLVAQGANIYRGAIVPEDGLDAEHPGARESGGVRMYRGVPIDGGLKPKSHAAELVSEDKPSPAKSKRVYRGRIIEE